MERKRTAPTTEANVLVRSRRRCAICFGLNRDVDTKQGQIAHIDHDSSNDKPGNLVFLCLEHHDKYDSRTSQSKGFTEDEIKRYRVELDDFLASSTFWPGYVPVGNTEIS